MRARAGGGDEGIQLHLERNAITLLLSNTLDDADEQEMCAPVDKVEVDLALSAHANAAVRLTRPPTRVGAPLQDAPNPCQAVVESQRNVGRSPQPP